VLDQVSDVIAPDRRTELAAEYAQMLGECLRAKETLVWPASGEYSSSLVLKGLLRTIGMQGGAAIPLGHPGRSQTALLMLWPETPELHAVVEEIEGLGLILGSLFASLTPDALRPRLTSLNWKKTLGIVVGLAAMVAISLLPYPYRLQVKAQVEPIELRYVVAGFDAIVSDVLVEPGDRLEQNEQLALLDGREIALELAAVVADSAKAMKLRDNHLVSGSIAAAQIALLEYQQLIEREELLRERLTRLVLVSPIAGVLLSGDLKRQIGGPVSKGQALFEIAPLERVLVTLGIPDEEISHVREGAAIEVRFDSFPDQVWQGSIKKLSPQTEAMDGQNLFLASSEFTNPDTLLQPGMSGRASISCGRQSLLWIYFHKPWYALLRLLDSLG
jgi:multidrug efflux pump subunit AcrA (membrane-fusion protein)